MVYLPPVDSTAHDTFARSINGASLPYEDDVNVTLRMMRSGSTFNASAIYALNQQHTRQVVATVFSSISLCAALCAIYWFYMMRRNFRRDLVLLLIAGGAWKSFSLILFSAVTFAKGPIQTESAFCQVNGYMLQVGFEACDFAVLFMSMHMYLQIFPPKRFDLGHDGLHRVRRWVWAAWVIVPNLLAGLAFINPEAGYMAQGGFCSVPIRPLWYRLALFWGFRYLIWLYIVFVAVAIYRYVGKEFKVFGQERHMSESMGIPGESSVDRAAQAQQERIRDKHLARQMSSLRSTNDEKDDDSHAPDDMSGISKIRKSRTLPSDSTKAPTAQDMRRQTVPTWQVPPNGFEVESNPVASPSRSLPTSRRGSRQIPGGIVTTEDFAPPPPYKWNPNAHRGSITSLGSKRSSTAPSIDNSLPLAPIRESVSSAGLDKDQPLAHKTMQMRRRAIQRQMRLLFIYPCIYMIFWLIPLVSNVMNYSDYYAQHPVFELGVVTTVCVTILTSVDVLIFTWRERPWSHIPGSSGTFLGSFKWWQFCFQKDWVQDRRASRAPSHGNSEHSLGDDAGQGRKSCIIGSFQQWRKRSSLLSSDTGATPGSGSRKTHKRTYSGGSDRKHLEAEQAHERLALEQAEYERNRQSLQERRASWVSQLQGQEKQPQSPGKKEWFDKEMSGELFRDNDLEANEKHTNV